jgi:ribosome-binding factor A
MSRRIERLNEQFKREVADILRFEVKDPRVGIVTVTEAQVAPDLSFARLYVSPMGDEDEKKEAFKGLAAASPYIRHELGKRLQIRQIPELRFEQDNALEYGMHIDRLLAEIKQSESERIEESDEDSDDEGGTDSES